VIAAVRDMTEPQKASQRREQMNRLSAVIEFSRDAIIGIKLDGVITSWNPAAARLFGYQSQEIVGRPDRLLIPQDRREETAAILATIKTGQAVENLETMAVRKDATMVPVCLTVSPIYDEFGTVIGAWAMARDLTGTRQGFESARSMIESSLDSLVAISPEGKITDVNQATVKVTGVPRDELIGTSFSTYFTEPEKADRIYKLVFSQGMALDYALTMRHRDGTLTEVLYNASVHREAGGEVVGVFAAARDVTKQVHAQREVAEQHAKERARLAELERFQAMTIDRALKVIELKKEIEALRRSDDTERGESDDQW
jgi:PAS domain S-box-containing protein